MIDDFFFTEQMNRLTDVFPNFTKGRYKRVFQFVENLPEKALEDIVNTMMDNFAHAPLPKDFHEAAIQWRKRNFTAADEILEVTPIHCTDCYDCGYLFGKLKDTEPTVLFYCHCATGGQVEALRPPWTKIPRWEQNNFDRAFGFIKLPFPLKAFVPNEEEKIGGGDMRDWGTVKRWTSFIAKSEKYYDDKGKAGVGA